LDFIGDKKKKKKILKALVAQPQIKCLLLLYLLTSTLVSPFSRLCTPLNGTVAKDVSNLFESIIGNFEDVVQYNRDNREFEGDPPGTDVEML
jgi:hypothetical protein